MSNATRSVFCELRSDLYEDCNFYVLYFFSFVICSSVEVEWLCLCFFYILVLVFTTSCR